MSHNAQAAKAVPALERVPSLAEIIQDEIKGKKTALGRYDSIIWKIRSGYAVLLYGGLSLTMKQVVQGDASLRKILPLVTSSFVLLLIAGFSFIAVVVDLSFLVQQLRVITATNELTEQLVNMATGKAHDENSIRKLMHISGQSHQKVDRKILWLCVWPVLILYASTPMVLLLLRLI